MQRLQAIENNEMTSLKDFYVLCNKNRIFSEGLRLRAQEGGKFAVSGSGKIPVWWGGGGGGIGFPVECGKFLHHQRSANPFSF